MKGLRVGSQFPVNGHFASCIIASLALWSAPVWAQVSLVGIQNGAATEISLFQNPADARYDVVALRVEFQPDSTDFTTGDGTFGGSLFEGIDSPILDPLPHDSDYFEAHLQFLENYIRRVSDGRTTIRTYLIPVVVQVSGRMGEYAPTGLDAGSDPQLRKLAGLVEESWRLAGSLDSFDLPAGLDPARTAFVIFHAGVGRDVELTGTTLDKTPEDLPSLFFSADTIDRLLGGLNVSVDGVPVMNTMIIPRTETRKGFNFILDEPFLAEFSINGMLAANFLSYLGVPDLFNTETGESGIGPFGVMDGLGIFAYGGLLPPEPTAWTKLYLGWADLILPDGSSVQSISLRHSGSEESNDVFLAPISEGEYFLVENRNRDPEGDGINLLVWRDGELHDVHFDNAAEGFNSLSRSGYPGGVVVDADNFDFALPGGKDDLGNALVGGALVWHVDERRLKTGLLSNRVNADPDRRAIDLEEADGGQDLGEPSLGIFGPAFEQGSPFDFFYAGNPTVVVTPAGSEIRLYQNRFGPETHPNSDSNVGGSSFIELSEFSLPGPEMELTYRRVNAAGILHRDDLSFSFDVAMGTIAQGSVLKYVGGDGVDAFGFFISDEGSAELQWAKSGQVVGSQSRLLPAAPALTNSRVIALGTGNFWELSPDGSFQVTAGLPSTLQITEVTTPIVSMIDDTYMVGAVDATGPFLLSAQFGAIQIDRFQERFISLAVVDGLRPVYVFPTHTEIPTLSKSWTYEMVPQQEPLFASFSKNESGLTGVIPDPQNSRLIILHQLGTTLDVAVNAYEEIGVSGTLNRYPIIVDLDDDSRPDILAVVGETLIAFNQEGAVVNGFPVKMRAGTNVQPLVVHFEDDSAPVILIASVDGRIDAYDLGKRSRRVPGFPLSVGSELNVTLHMDGTSLFAVSGTGAVSRWDFSQVDKIVWGELFSTGNRSFFELPERLQVGGFGDGGENSEQRRETYNWPNPIREGVTWIRFRPGSVSDVEITIVDMTGQHVETLEMKNAPAGVSSEIPWRPTVGSGVYLARVQLTDGSGRVRTHLIKMAVIR
ncbi:MAG: T9SS type A sorting domain-containing protein [Bacteroidetes bacterium]|nr:MAG: T9SS type A sorting domain-containing protein [Bacteroidota bacterium]